MIALEKPNKKVNEDPLLDDNDLENESGSESELESDNEEDPTDDEKSINDEDDNDNDNDNDNANEIDDEDNDNNSIQEEEPQESGEWNENMMQDFEPDDFSEDDDDYEDDLQKFKDYQMISSLESQHPEIKQMNYDEIIGLTKIVKNRQGNIVDPLHTTLPILTKYEKARLIGSRAEQINRGAMPAIQVDDGLIDGRTIATMEFEKKAIPFIIARPLPSGAIEYWKIQDLEVL